MDILKFVKSLLPNFERKTLLEDIRATREEIKSHTLPPFETAVSHFDHTKFESRLVQAFDRELEKTVKTRIRGNSVRLVYEALKFSQDHLDALESLGNRILSDDVARSAMTYQKAALLQTVQTVGFMVRYARTWLNWVLIEEAYATETPGSQPSANVMKNPELDYLSQYQESFFHALTVTLQSARDLEKTIKETPDALVEEDTYGVSRQTLGLTKIDPLRMGLFSVSWNPIYHVAMAVAEWQAARYKAAKEEAKLLELRLLQLEQEYRETPNAKLQENVEYNQERLDKLKYKLKKLEERYA